MPEPVFKKVDPRVSFPKLETEVLELWREIDVLRKSLARHSDGPRFVFYEGPPTANSKPHIGNVLTRAYKDAIPRYRSMAKGENVPRIAGWDTHGLPVEIMVERSIGSSGKKDIEEFGIAKFNELCKKSVFQYIDEWNRVTERMGFWLDTKAPYVTCSRSYMESVWWILKSLWDRGLLFTDYKVTMHCPRCSTSLADHEVSQGFKDDVDDPSVWIKFAVKSVPAAFPHELPDPTYLVAWTTTPWTLPANLALAVDPAGEYLLAETGGEHYVVASALADSTLGEGYDVVHRFKGTDLAGVTYVPLFKGMTERGVPAKTPDAYPVIADEIVSMDEGTGIVHIAPAYGDLEVGRRHALPTVFSVDLHGNTYEGYEGFGGKFFKQADPLIMADLRGRGLVLREARVKHAYPFCWRCETPLLYYAKNSWYIKTTAVKDRMIALNDKIGWIPEHIRKGRFGNWLENNVDWAISRERYWGTPLPVWECDSCGERRCVGSVAELEAATGRDLAELDLHRPFVDEISWKCTKCGSGTSRRVPYVIDVWFDSGAMPVCQWHYPFEHEDDFKRSFPADFISEAVDQTRGWFYSLHAIASLMFDEVAYKNVICLGHVLDEDGFKMSKSKGNVVDPWSVFDVHGADALRWHFYAASPPGNPRRFAASYIDETVRRFLLTLWNTYSFFVTYANIDGWKPGLKGVAADGRIRDGKALQPIDRWVLSYLHSLTAGVRSSMDAYDINGACRAIEGFVEDLSNWYVRRNRRRFWKSESDEDKLAAYSVLYECLETLARLLAPFVPFVSEAMYQNLVRSVTPDAPESVHLSDYPEAERELIDERLLRDMNLLLKVVRLGRAARNESRLKARQPLSVAVVCARESGEADSLRPFVKELTEELNVKAVDFADSAEDYLTTEIKLNHKIAGPKLKGLVKDVQKALAGIGGERASEIARGLRAGEKIVVAAGGADVELDPEDLSVSTSSAEGYAASEEGGYVVAVSTVLSEELVQEGMARDLVRNIQEMRKKAGYDIADRIRTRVMDPPDAIGRVLGAFGGYISQETLSESLSAAGVEYAGGGPTSAAGGEGSEFTHSFRISDMEIKVAISRIPGKS
jgi:isoleucyl-tRNA synthetase